MRKKGLTLIEIIITCSLMVVLIIALSTVTRFHSNTLNLIEKETFSLYALESLRNKVLVDLRNGHTPEEILEANKSFIGKAKFNLRLETLDGINGNKRIRLSLSEKPRDNELQMKPTFREVLLP